MKKKAIIISIKGLKLTKEERILLLNENPWGLILFKRNIKSLNQIKLLIGNIRNITKDKNFPILIDEEGATVSRLINLINHKFTAKNFGSLYLNNKKLCITLYKKYLDSLCKILKNIGLNFNTIPVLDVLRSNTSSVIDDRSFSKNPKTVKLLGQITVKHCHKNKVICVIKHIPGHGCATSDSHYETPIVKTSIKKLKEIDFYPFKNNFAKMAMTAHILYKKIDTKNVATFSTTIISKIIRKKIGFNGILISDDISMKALKYDLITNAKKSIEAGCNLVLYCAGNINDNLKLIKSVPYIDKFTSEKTSEIYKILR